MLNYLIAGTPRCGSGLLSRALNSQGVGAPDEYFSRAAVHLLLVRRGLADVLSTSALPKPVHGTDYAAEVRSAATLGGVVGITVHWYQLSWAEDTGLVDRLLDVFPDRRGVRVVLLRRIDRVGQAISQVIADATRRYYWEIDESDAHVSAGYEDRSVSRPHYSFERLQELISTIESDNLAWDGWLDLNRIRPLEVYYEDLDSHFADTVQRVVSYLTDGERSVVVGVRPSLQRQRDGLNESFRKAYLADLEERKHGCL
jgi:LPS sulfotransferase NodH